MTDPGPPPPRRIERRRAPRVRMPARGGAVSVVGARLLNVSVYGMLIESPVPMTRDAVLRMRLMVTGRPTDVEARVAVCNAQPGLRTYGVGLEFAGLTDTDRDRLARALAAAAGDSPPEE